MSIRAHFEHPPLVEVAFGALFSPLVRLSIPYIGQLWDTWRADYPTCQEAPPLYPTVETDDVSSQMSFALSNIPLIPRVWFTHKNGNSVIQLQRDRFLHNWRKGDGTTPYPHYEATVTAFEQKLEEMGLFLKENDLGEVGPRQYEITYIDHILPVADDAKLSIVEYAAKVFPAMGWHAPGSFPLPHPSGVNWQVTFEMPEKVGRIHFKLQTALMPPQRIPFLLLESTARSMGTPVPIDNLRKWFDAAHELMLEKFLGMVNYEVQSKDWGRTI